MESPIRISFRAKALSGRVETRPDRASLLGKRLAKVDLPVHRNDREDQRKPLAVAVRPSGTNFRSEAVVALVGDLASLKGGRFEFGGSCG
jgi:hypothetical protein